MTQHASFQERVEALFVELLPLGREERERLLDARCAGDPAMRDEVESLLGHHSESPAFLDAAAIRKLAEQEDDVELAPGTKVGEFTISGPLGKGGMGLVYLATQARPARTVALKVVRRSLSGYSILRRFELEAEMLGRLRHPGIAQIFQAGVADFGLGPTPYIAMEYVKGRSITDTVRETDPGVNARLELVAQVCDAVQHAHQRGIIHRDLKPANIIVDDAGHPKVLDFGVARATDGDLQVTTLRTDLGQLIGTLAYMSPEQVLGDPREVDTRSDVYAMGVVLYQLLAGRLPLDLSKASLADAARRVQDEHPARLGSLNPAFKGDIELIAAKAMEKNKTRRYQSAEELARDLRAAASGEAVLARQGSRLYALRKGMRRHRGAVLAGVAALLALVAFAAYAATQARRQRELAGQERGARIAADAAERIARAQAESLRLGLYVSNIGFAQAALAARDRDRVDAALDSCPEDLRGWEWTHLRAISDTSDLVIPMPGSRSMRAVASAQGTIVAAIGYDHHLRLADPRSGEPVASIDLSGVGRYPTRAFPSAVGGTVAASVDHRALVVIDARSGAVRRLGTSLDPAGGLFGLSADGTRALAWLPPPGEGEGKGRLGIIDVEADRVVRRYDAAAPLVAIYSPDERIIALGNVGGVGLLDADTGVQIKWFSAPGAAHSISFAPDGSRFAFADYDGNVNIVDASTLTLQRVPVSSNKLFAASWSPDGTHIALGGSEGAIFLYNVARLGSDRVLSGHGLTIDTVAWAPDGSIISGARDGTIRRWENPLASPQPETRLGQPINSGVWLPDESAIIVGDQGGRIVRVDRDGNVAPGTWPTLDGWIVELAVSPDGAIGAAVAYSGTACFFRIADGAELARVKAPDGRAIDVNFMPGGELVSVGSDADHLAFYNPLTGELAGRTPTLAPGAARHCWSPDGATLAVQCGDNAIRILDARTLETLHTCEPAAAFAWQIRFSPDGSQLLAAIDDGMILSWSTRDWTPLPPFVGHKGGVFTISVSPDGRRLASGGWDNTVRIWDLPTRRELLTMRVHTSSVHVSEFSPNGAELLTCGGEGLLKMWGRFEPPRVMSPMP